jgi:sigma-B regulation protein RsbU (phosphoserine phosphatase)
MSLMQSPNVHENPQRWLGRLLLPFGVLAAAVLVDYLLPPDVVVVTAFSLAPLTASALATARQTAVVAVASLVMVLVSTLWNHDLDSVQWWRRVVLTAAFGGFAIVLAGIRVRREKALHRMTVVAETVQRAVLPVIPDEVNGVRLAARYVSATEDALVGGDLYEVVDTPYGVRLIVADVRGKGLDAVRLASMVLAAFRHAALLDATLEDVATDLDTAVTTVANAEDFVTAVLAEFREEVVSLVNCGHHPPLMLRLGEPPHLVETGQPVPPLGLGTTPRAVVCEWPEAARVLLYTDGVVEARVLPSCRQRGRAPTSRPGPRARGAVGAAAPAHRPPSIRRRRASARGARSSLARC